MPIFEFKCGKCGHNFEELVLSSQFDIDDLTCPKCGSNSAEKQMSVCASNISGSSSSSSLPPCGRSGFS